MTFFKNLVLSRTYISDKSLYFVPIRWIHDDSMYVRFVGIRNTKDLEQVWLHPILPNSIITKAMTMYSCVPFV